MNDEWLGMLFLSVPEVLRVSAAPANLCGHLQKRAPDGIMCGVRGSKRDVEGLCLQPG